MAAYPCETLEQLLAEDQLGRIFQTQKEARAAFAEDPRIFQFKRVQEMVAGVSLQVRARLNSLGPYTQEGQVACAKILGVSPEDAQAFVTLVADMRVAAAVPLLALKAQWDNILPYTRIKGLTAKAFMRRRNRKARRPRPYIVFYGVDWDTACHITKPAFAQLSFFVDKNIDLFYSSDDILWRKEGIESVPQLVAYFPNGARGYSECGVTAKEFWDRINTLVILLMANRIPKKVTCTGTECETMPQ